ncbi:hypothetical protein ACFSAA_15980, partial [Sphingomonas qilianensis]
MILGFRVLAWLAVVVPLAAGARPAAGKQARPPAAKTVPVVSASVAAARVADWVAASQDNHALPYIVIDKTTASLSFYDAGGEMVGRVPVLIGVAIGDDASPGVGSKNLAEIGPAEKTTPAGRFLAKFGRPIGKERILWV